MRWCIVEGKDLFSSNRLGWIYFSVMVEARALVWLCSVTARRWNWRIRAASAVGLSKTIPKRLGLVPEWQALGLWLDPNFNGEWCDRFFSPWTTPGESLRRFSSASAHRLSSDVCDLNCHVPCPSPCPKKLFAAAILNQLYMPKHQDLKTKKKQNYYCQLDTLWHVFSLAYYFIAPISSFHSSDHQNSVDSNGQDLPHCSRTEGSVNQDGLEDIHKEAVKLADQCGKIMNEMSTPATCPEGTHDHRTSSHSLY